MCQNNQADFVNPFASDTTRGFQPLAHNIRNLGANKSNARADRPIYPLEADGLQVKLTLQPLLPVRGRHSLGTKAFCSAWALCNHEEGRIQSLWLALVRRDFLDRVGGRSQGDSIPTLRPRKSNPSE
jgi:hypothetical protein